MVQNWFKGIIDGAWTFMMGSGPDWGVTTEDVVQNVWQKMKNKKYFTINGFSKKFPYCLRSIFQSFARTLKLSKVDLSLNAKNIDWEILRCTNPNIKEVHWIFLCGGMRKW